MVDLKGLFQGTDILEANEKDIKIGRIGYHALRYLLTFDCQVDGADWFWGKFREYPV